MALAPIACVEDDGASAPDVAWRLEPIGSSVEAACWAVGVLPATCDPASCPSQWQCPAELDAGWKLEGTHMFVDGTAALADLGLVPDDLPLALRRFCHYRAEKPDLVLDEPKIPASVDCPAAHAQGDPDELRLGLTELFGTSVDVLLGDMPDGGKSVDLAIVDTRSDRALGPASVGHGPAMAHIAGAIACGSKCEIDVSHALALPLGSQGERLDPDDGTYGTRAHVAVGIVEAVSAHRQRLFAGEGSERLVINLSVGWTTASGAACGTHDASPWCDDHVGELATWLTAPSTRFPAVHGVEAVHTALLYAACNGALIVAAAGNAREDSCNADPVAPAVWSAYATPTIDDCHLLGFDPPAQVVPFLPTKNDDPSPLVHAVAAIRSDDTPIAATRPDSLTPLVADGDHVTVDAGDLPLTGTSVSAAAVSGAAALVWSHDGALRPAEVIRRLYDAGTSIGRVSQMPAAGWPAGTDVRRLAVCPALLGASCHTEEDRKLTIEQTAKEIGDTAMAGTTVEFDETKLGLAIDDCLACGQPTIAWVDHDAGGSQAGFANACVTVPDMFVFDAGPSLAGPQPNVPVCPYCPLVLETSTGAATAYLAIDPSYRDGSLLWAGANLVIEMASGKRRSIALGDTLMRTALADGERVAFSLPGSWSDIVSASFAAELVDATTGESMVRGNELLLLLR